MSEVSYLQNARVFSNLPLPDLRQIEVLSKELICTTNQLIHKAGSAPEHVVVVLEGALHVVDALDDGRLCHVGIVRPGESVGWISAIDGLPTASHVIAASSDTRVLLVPFVVVRALFNQRPAFSRAVMTILASTIRQYMRTRAALSAPSVAERLFRVILGLAQDAGEAAGLVLPKQQDLATLANTSRETVSRTMQELIRSGVLQKNGHQVVVRDLAALQRLAVGKLS